MPLNAAQLYKLIVDENPYASTTPVQLDDVIEVQVELGTWQFKGTPHFIEKAIRISYTYTDASLHTIRDYILVGYEGGGAY
jgi:hypothetical protein